MTNLSHQLTAKDKSPSRPDFPAMTGINGVVARKLREYADILVRQGESGFRSRAFQRAAAVIETLPRGLDKILADEGREGLVALPTVGYAIAAAIAEILATGRWSQLDRVRGELQPETLFQTIPGIGPRLSRRLAVDAHLESLEDLECALYRDNLNLRGIGKRRKQMIGSALSERIGSSPQKIVAAKSIPVETLLLEIDRTYRERAASGELLKITPRRFNPKGEAWLPIMHMERDGWNFTVLFSNSRLAHELHKTHDWVIIHFQRDGEAEGRCTVVTETSGPMKGKRVVRGG